MFAKLSILSISLLFAGAFSGFAQQKGEVIVIKDTLITLMQQARMGTNISTGNTASSNTTTTDRNSATRSIARGFRVQIYSGSSRNDAYAEQARFQRMFRNIDTYVSYDEPNYRVKVGDFRSRSEAQELMQSLRNQFNNVFLFQEDIFVYQ